MRSLPPVSPPTSTAGAAPVENNHGLAHADAPHILWIDDELGPGDALLRLLTYDGFHNDVANTGANGLAKAYAHPHDAIVLDLCLPDMYGLTVLRRLVAQSVRAPVLVATGHYLEPEVMADAWQAGAAAFHYKPFLDVQELAGVLRSLITSARSRTPAPVEPRWRYGIVAASRAMQNIVDWVERVGPTSRSALITGETGTGKELVARALHQVSARSNKPFVALNCATISDSLVETELFGHRKGAFTGAVRDREGLFEAADGGTLFLDEIGDLSPPIQACLLRVLEDGQIRRVGDTKTIHVDVRIVAATSRSLHDADSDRRFRQDLYYRIAMSQRHLPPLRQRLDDLDALVAYALPDLARRNNRPITAMAAGALDRLRAHTWPGNVRELLNTLSAAVQLASGTLITEPDVSEALAESVDVAPIERIDRLMPDRIRRALTALDESRWNRTEAARSLGVNRSTLWRWLAQHRAGQRADEP